MTKATQQKVSILEAAYEWQIRLADPEIDDRAVEAFNYWLASSPSHRDAFERAGGVVSALGELKPGDIDQRHIKETLTERRVRWLDQISNLIDKVRSKWVGLGAALSGTAVAAIVIVMFLPSTTPEPGATIVSQHASGLGETTSVKLSDGTTMDLGARTAVTVHMQPNKREVQLDSGAAMFNVRSDPDRPFLVTTGDVVVKVVGTTFDVRMNGGVARVSVAEGNVEVRNPIVIAGRQTGGFYRTALKEGQEVHVTNDQVSDVLEIDPNSVGTWRTSRLEYRRAPLSEVVADANRYSAQTILVTDPKGELAGVTVSASFDGQRVERMLQMLPKILPVIVDTSDQQNILIKPLPEKAGE
ncbi:MAG: FecR domain-containing protein [Pseudomonadota bacterium]